MVREKSEIEKNETPQEQADRLRYALFIIGGLNSVQEIERVARCAMRGELHGHERPKEKSVDYSRGPIPPFPHGMFPTSAKRLEDRTD